MTGEGSTISRRQLCSLYSIHGWEMLQKARVIKAFFKISKVQILGFKALPRDAL